MRSEFKKSVENAAASTSDKPEEIEFELDASSRKEHAGSNDKTHDLTMFIRLLMKEPPPHHDFRTCSICRRYGIVEI